MRDRFHIAEGEPVVDLLEGLHDYQRKHSRNDDAQIRNNSQVKYDLYICLFLFLLLREDFDKLRKEIF